MRLHRLLLLVLLSLSWPLLAQTNPLWVATLSGTITETPVVNSDGIIFVASEKELKALTPDGNTLWTYTNGAFFTGAPTIAPNGNVVIHSTWTNGFVLALSSDGRLLWSTNPGPRPDPGADLAVDAYGTVYGYGSMYVRTTLTDQLFAIDSLGRTLWTHVMTFDDPLGHPVVDASGLIFTFGPWSAAAFRPTGMRYWYKLASASRWGVPSIKANGELLCHYKAPYLTPPGSILMTADGAILSSNTFALPGVLWTSLAEPAIARDGTAYFSVDRLLACVDPNGSLRWTNLFTAPAYSGDPTHFVPALDSLGNVYVVSKTAVIAYDAQGREAQRWPLAALPSGPLVLTADGSLYVPASGKLYAFRALAGLDVLAPWPMYRQNPAGTASRQTVVAPVETPVINGVIPYPDKVRIQCETPTRAYVVELYRSVTPSFAEATLVAQSTTNNFYAEDTNLVRGIEYWYWVQFRSASSTSALAGPVRASMAELKTNWLLNLEGGEARPPAIGPEGTVYASGTYRLVALNRDSATQWELPGATAASVTPDGSVLANVESTLYCLSSAGATNWSIEGVTAASCPPAVAADGRFFVCNTNSELCAYSREGRPLWQFPLGGDTAAWPAAVASDGSVVVLTVSNTVHQVNAHGSSAVTTSLTNFGLSGVPPVLDQQESAYLVSTFPEALVAISRAGAEKWRLPLAHRLSTAPAVAPDGSIITPYSVRVPMAKKTFFTRFYVAAVSTNGALGWMYPVPSQPSSPIVTADGSVVFTSGTNLTAVRASDGQVRWQMESPNGKTLGTPMLDHDGTLFVPMQAGLLSVKLPTGPAASGWPVSRQNPRQSACIQQTQFAQIVISCPSGAQPELQILAPSGAVLLHSTDLVHWERLGFQPSCTKSVPWPLLPETNACSFYRAVTP